MRYLGEWRNGGQQLTIQLYCKTRKRKKNTSKTVKNEDFLMLALQHCC
jgi:hypothetical protein